MSFRQAFSYMTSQELATRLRTTGRVSSFKVVPESDSIQGDKKLAVVDVRDDDYEGGHIKGAIHSPSTSFLNGGVESLREMLKETPIVVFHCALSQIRGPKAARIYAESTEEIRQKGGEAPIPQEIYVLRGGFVEFQALYKNDNDLVEDYDSDYYN